MKKTISILALVVLVAAVSILGTMAYLTSTDTVTNTFTVGKVEIKLDEAKVNADGKPVDKQGNVVTELASADRVKQNSYKLMPGHSYTKDPTVTVVKGSESSYVRLLVTVKFDNALTDATIATSLDSIFTGYNATDWNRTNKSVSEDNTTITYEYRYKNAVGATSDSDVKLSALFTGFTVPGTWTGDNLNAVGGFTITVVAQAIQADGFTTADAAWATYNE